MRSIYIIIAALWLVVVCCAVPALPISSDKVAKFCVPRTSVAPTIDGNIDPAEWREASAVSGVVSQQSDPSNVLVMRPTTFYLAWDADNIYLACRTWIMPGYKPSSFGRAPGTATALDDGMELNLKPMGKNVPTGKADSSYKFFISCLGITGDLSRVSVGQLFRNWQPKFRLATRMTAPGSAPQGGRWWEAEVAMSTKDFELTGPNRAGDQWRMLLGFNHIPMWIQAAIPMSSAYFDASGFPLVTLVENTPAVQVTMDDLPGPLDGVAAVKFSAYNPTSEPVKLGIHARYNQIDDKGVPTAELLSKDTTLDVPAGRSATFSVNEKSGNDLGKNTGSIEYRVTEGEKVLYRYFAYLRLGYPENWVKVTPPTEAFQLKGTFNPVRNNYQLTADTYPFADPDYGKALKYRIIRDGDSKPVAEGSITEKSYWYFTRLVELPGLTEGSYNVEATMLTPDGKTLGPVKTSFKKIDEAKAFPDWWKNKIGDCERVIPPFTPVAKSRDSVSMWGRTYRLDSLGLPHAVVSQGKKVLTSPARIVAVIDGKEVVVPLNGSPRFTESKPWRVSFTGTAHGAGLAFTADGSIEQDGLALINLTYRPVGGAPVKVDALRLEFPIDSQQADCLVCIGPGANFASLTATVLLKTKQGRLWSTLDLGKGGSLMTVGSFYPDVWVGSEERGFLWWADSDQGWVPDDDIPAHEVLRKGGEVVLRNNIIGKSFTITGPRTITFSYMASPFKPLVKGWRMALHSEDGTFDGPHRTRTDPKTGQPIHGWTWLNPPSNDPAEWSTIWAEYKKIADEKVHREQPFDPGSSRNREYVHVSLPLAGYGPHTGDEFVRNYFASEWGDSTLSDSQTDYEVWLFDRALREGGLRAIYWDIFYALPFNSLQAGMGYTLPDGRVQMTFNGFNERKFMRRFFAAMYDNGLAPGGLVAHSTNCYPLVAFPWVDATLDGEWAEITDATSNDWVDFYSTDRLRSMSVSDTWGVQITWMSLFHVTDQSRVQRLSRSFLDYQRLHDTWMPPYNRGLPPDSILAWGLNDQRLQYVPYWRNPFVVSDDKELLISAWRLPDRVLFEVFNYNGKVAKDASLDIDLKAFGLAGTGGIVTARELGASGDPGVSLASDGTVSVIGLQPHTARYFGLRMEKKTDVARLQKEFAALGHGAVLTEEMRDWGVVSPDTRFFPYGKSDAVTSDAPEVHVAMWQLADRVLLVVTNESPSDAKTATITVDLDKLGLVPKLPWQEFVRVHDFDGGSASLDYYARKLTVPDLRPGSTRVVGIRRY